MQERKVIAVRVLITPDSFKGSVTSREAAECIEAGLKKVWPEVETDILPVADGGEGTMDALIAGMGGSRLVCRVHDPLGREIEAEYGLLPARLAVIEMAQASGLPLLSPEERDPGKATTYGTGELIRAALDRGCRRILVGIGGSATNDGGAGMAAALGAVFLDADGNELEPCGYQLERLSRIDFSRLDPRIAETEFLVASDVVNPMCGELGASVVYGPQKGATEDQVRQLDRALAHYGEVLRETFGEDYAVMPGAGAAGGLGAALMAFCNAEITPGIDIIFCLLGMREHMERADLIMTGEGRIDATSANGKLLTGIGRMALEYQKPVVALTGSLGAGYEELYKMGISAVLPIADGPITSEESMRRAPELIRSAAERAARLINIKQMTG